MPYLYVPKEVMPHLDDVMKRKNAKKKADGFRHLAQYALVGKEMENIKTLTFPKKPLPRLFPNKNKYKKRGWF